MGEKRIAKPESYLAWPIQRYPLSFKHAQKQQTFIFLAI